MKAEVTIEFIGGHALEISNGKQWHEAAILLTHALNTYLESYLPPEHKNTEALAMHFEQQRPTGEMSTGYKQARIKLLASRSLIASFEETEERL